jgi:hypothetical protein
LRILRHLRGEGWVGGWSDGAMTEHDLESFTMAILNRCPRCAQMGGFSQLREVLVNAFGGDETHSACPTCSYCKDCDGPNL